MGDPIQTLMRTFRVNSSLFDETFGVVEAREPSEVLAERFGLVIAGLQTQINRKGYDFLIGSTKLHRGIPERVLVVDHRAPFCLDDEYRAKLDSDFLESARGLNLPYEAEETFIDMSRRRLG